ncbi:glutamine--fructose-6-phosphate aminotransferase, partial [Candidatus Parcubacteria bacterium]
MCGIVGYLGKEQALPILLGGLKNLEYRGYDSAGVVVGDGRKAHAAKSVGRVSDLESNLKGNAGVFKGTVGIAHTRWATHGGVTERNAHPQWDCGKNIYVVHNGIVENFKEIKAALRKRGHKFVSETDTEVFPHLIEEERKTEISLEEAVRRAVRRVRGTYGIVVFDAREQGKLVGARNFSPLMLGVGAGEFVIGSDANAVLTRTNKVVYMKNGEVAVVAPDSYRIVNVENELIERRSETLEGKDLALARKGGYPHFMLKEICEQPEAIENSIRGRLLPGRGEAVLGGLREVEKDLRAA